MEKREYNKDKVVKTQGYELSFNREILPEDVKKRIFRESIKHYNLKIKHLFKPNGFDENGKCNIQLDLWEHKFLFYLYERKKCGLTCFCSAVYADLILKHPALDRAKITNIFYELSKKEMVDKKSGYFNRKKRDYFVLRPLGEAYVISKKFYKENKEK